MHNIEIDRSKKYYRAWEYFPGLLTWGTFLLPIILSIYFPYLIASLVIIYALYWLSKAIRMSIHLIIGYQKYRQEIEKDWLKLCKDVPPKNSWKKIYHVIILATYKEDIEIVRHSIRAIIDSHYPVKKNVIFVLASEKRDEENAKKNARILKKEFNGNFKKFIASFHPANTIGEVKGKGSNITFAARKMFRYINNEKIPHSDVIVTTLDADNRVHTKYLANLTYLYLRDDNPTHKSFQPLAMFFNNIWQVPLIIRSIAVGSSFWQMIESTRPYRLRNFSAHAQSLAGLVKTDFWSVKTIVEDGHQYWRSYLAFDGDYAVVPLYVPVYQDAILSPKGYWGTFVEQYLQKRRWAWGCSDIPYVMTNFIGNNKLPFWHKWIQTGRLIEGHYSWSTTSIILACVGWMPSLLNSTFRNTVLAYNFPVIYSRILTVAMIGLVVTLTISLLLLPPKPKKSLTWSVIMEWLFSPILLPLSNIIFSSFPAIDSQTRLLLGKYLEFRVTEKAVIEKAISSKQ